MKENRIYKNLKILIMADRYVYDDMKSKIDLFYSLNNLDEAEHEELKSMLKEKQEV